MEQELILTTSQEEQIIQLWNDGAKDLKAIVVKIFGPDFDGRSKEGLTIKRFLATKDLKARSSFQPDSKTSKIILTEDQKLFIANHSASMSWLEMAKDLFNNRKITALFAEARVVKDYYDQLNPTININLDSTNDTVYKAPRNFAETLNRIFKYVQNCKINRDKLSQRDKNNIETLRGFLNNLRYVQTINVFQSLDDRELLEDRFVNYTHDKSDLTPEEVDAYLNLCLDVVDEKKLNAKIDLLNNAIMEAAGEERIQISMSVAELIKNAETERNANRKRQETVRNNLTIKRKDRMDARINSTSSMVDLVVFFQDKQNRDTMLKLAQFEEGKLKEEITRISNLDQLKALVAGVSEEEILYGE